MAVASNDRALIASSEFDPTSFIRGIDEMTEAVVKLSAREDALKIDIKNVSTALTSNRQEVKVTTDQINALDKNSKTYADDLVKLNAQQKLLKDQQKELVATLKTNKEALTAVNKSANDYKAALTGITAISKQVAQENKGRTLFDVVSMNKQVQEITQMGGRLRNAFQGRISTAELDKFEAALAQTSDEFQQLAQIVTFVKSKLDTLDPNSQEFADLNKIVATGETVLEAYGNQVVEVDKKSVSLRGRLTALRTELVAMEEQGLENTEQFQKLQIEAGRLQDSISDAQQRIKVLSSDTRNLDFGIGAIRGVASAFGVAEGAAALFGLKNEDVAKSLQRLNAIMLILNGLQEIQTLLQKQSVVAIVSQEIATKGAAIAQRIYATAVGTSTGAMRVFRLALLGTGIGAFVAVLGLAASAMDLFGSETKGTKEEIEDFNLELEISNRNLTRAAQDIQFRNNLAIEAAKQRGATEEEISKLVVSNLRNEANVNREVAQEKVRDVTTAVATFTQGAVIIDPESINTLNDAVVALGEVERAQQRISRLPGVTDEITQGMTAAVAAAKDIVTVFQTATDLDRQASEEVAKTQTKRLEDGRKGAEKEAENYRAFLERLANLQRQLRDKLLESQPQDEAAIRTSFTNQLNDITQDIDREVAAKKLTRKRGNILLNLLGEINTVDLQKALKDFNDKVVQEQQKFDDQIFEIQIRNANERAEFIREQFTREARTVQLEQENQTRVLIREREEIITSINQTRDDGLISPAAAQRNIEQVQVIYEQLLENLTIQTTRKQEEISSRVFAAAQEEVKRVFTGATVIVSEVTTLEIQKLSQRYLDGRITYERFQKELTRISAEESTKRIAQNLREQTELLKNAQRQLAVEQDPDRRKALQDEIIALRQQIADLDRQLAVADAEGTSKDQQARTQRIQELAQYAQAIGGIVQQVVNFWAQANEAEQRSLERSIQLQETRVQAATRLAERGNAEYLRLEEDRLNELQVKQENAARRQLAINAVVQTSQALVAFVTALAQGIATGGPIGGIAIAASVIAAIAAGFAIIQSLQPTPQGFKEGTKSVERKGQPAGVDTVPAMLTEGEAVIPARINKQYSPAVAAIYDRKIPAEVINRFVNNYRVNSRVLPVMDHQRMTEATEVKVTYDAQLLAATQEQTRVLAEQTELLGRVDKRLKNLGISVNVDRNGLAISVLKATEQFAIDKKV